MCELRLNGASLETGSPDALAQALRGLKSNSHVVLHLQASSGSDARLGVPTVGSTSTSVGVVYELLAALAGSHHHRALRFSIRGLSAALPEPPAELLELLQHSDTIVELQLEDTSIERLAHEGAGNLLRTTSTPPVPAWYTASLYASQPLLGMPATPINNSAGGAFSLAQCADFDKSQDHQQSQSCGHHAHKTQQHVRMPVSDDFRARGTGLLRLAAAMPSLRRLSVRAAVFPAAEVAALAAALPLLEELSLDGAMEVDTTGPAAGAVWTSAKRGAAVSAAAATSAAASHVYKGLLAALPWLRLLRLPMPLAASQLRLMAQPLAAVTAAHSPFVADQHSVPAGLPAPLPLLYDSDDEDDFDCYSLASTHGGSGSSCGGSSSIFGSWSVAGASAASTASGADGFLAQAADSSWRAPAGAGATFAAPVPATPKAVPLPAAAEPDWVFPSRLSELSVPMCAANGPVFFAALTVRCSDCNGKVAEAEVEEETDQAQEQQRGGLRALHVPCPAGYSPWDGAFLKTEQDFAALAGLAPALEVLHLALPPALTAPAAAGLLRACLSHLTKLRDVKELHISEAKLPACFSVRKHQPAPTEYLAFRCSGHGAPAAAATVAASKGAALLTCLVRCPAPAFATPEVATTLEPQALTAFVSPAAMGAPLAVNPVTPPPRRVALPSPVPWQPAATSSAFGGVAARLFAPTPSGLSPIDGVAAAGSLAMGALPPLPALPLLRLGSASSVTPTAGASAFSCVAAEPTAAGPGSLLPLAFMSGPSVFSRAPPAAPGSARTAARALGFDGPAAATVAATPAAPATPAAAPNGALGAAAAAAGATSTSSALLLSRLLLQWPRLESVVLLGHSVMRTPAGAESAGRGAGAGTACLVAPSSLEELMALRHSSLRGSSYKAGSKSGSDDDGTGGGSRGSRRTRSLASQFAAATVAADDAADAHRRAAKRHRHDRAVAAAVAATAGGASSGPATDGSIDSDDQGNSPLVGRIRACGCSCGVCGGFGRGGGSSSASGDSSCGSGDEGDASDVEAAAAAQRMQSRMASGFVATLAKHCNCCA